MKATARPTILCVDDEPQLLEGLALQLELRYRLLTASGGAEGLALLEREPATGVVISDMRMPGMDGAVFLTKVRESLPDTVRILLTGQTDLTSAIAAVNEGQVFRFLTKPCAPPLLLATVEAAVRQHQLVTAERELLEKTLLGSVKALCDLLGLTSPSSFGRAARIRQRVVSLAQRLGVRERWHVEIAAMVSQLGAVVLPPEVGERLYSGKALSEGELKMVARCPEVTEQILGNIPRLELVRSMLERSSKPRVARSPETGADALVTLGAEMLRIASDFDVLETRGTPRELAIGTLRGRGERYDRSVLEAFGEVVATEEAQLRASTEVRELTVSALRVGMVFAEDVQLAAGALLVARGYEITLSFLERARNFPRGAIREPMRVLAPPG